MRENRTSGSPSGDWKRSGSKSGYAGPPPRQSSTLPDFLFVGALLTFGTEFKVYVYLVACIGELRRLRRRLQG